MPSKRKIEAMEKLTLVFEPAEKGGYCAYVAEVPGLNSQGETIEEAREMVLEALPEMLEYRRAVQALFLKTFPLLRIT